VEAGGAEGDVPRFEGGTRDPDRDDPIRLGEPLTLDQLISDGVPASPRMLAGASAVAGFGACVATIGLAAGSGDDLARGIYLGGLAMAIFALAVVAYAYEGRRQAIAHAKRRAHVHAATASRQGHPVELDGPDLELASSDLVVLEEARDRTHVRLLREALGVPDHDERRPYAASHELTLPTPVNREAND
jgi:hypothetical protein